jgi:F-type H+-transporting ATPase subunit b
MIINWYTVIFQIINFLILVFLLRYFLYGPIIRAMDERERMIVEREERAAASIEEAEAAAESYRSSSDDLRKNEELIMEKARAAAGEEKALLINAARKEVGQLRQRWEDAFDREKENFTVELRRRIGRQACAVARRCLADLADAELEKLIRSRFNHKLNELPEAEQQKLKVALHNAGYRATVTAAFDFPDKAWQDLKVLMAKMFPVADDQDQLELTVKKDAGLVCGLELAAGGYRIAWNIDDYLVDVEEQILVGLEQKVSADQDGEETGSD